MQCPVCTDTTLLMANRSEIEIDYCPKCRGVWLDRGELDKLIERAASSATASAAPPPPTREPDPRYRADQDRQYDRHYEKHDDDDDYRKHGYHKRRRGFLGDLFDFD